jgi:Response regulator containing CheY-like receiver, AAA-type ATPase, and DNA-binding domains
MRAAHFLKQAAIRFNLHTLSLTQVNRKELLAYSWPGNIRELQNVIERAVILARGRPLRFQLEGPAANSQKEMAPMPTTQKQWLQSRRAGIKTALEKATARFTEKVVRQNCFVYSSKHSIFAHREARN